MNDYLSSLANVKLVNKSVKWREHNCYLDYAHRQYPGSATLLCCTEFIGKWSHTSPK